MAETKAEQALKDAKSKSNIKIKVFYAGDSPAESGSKEFEYGIEPLDKKHYPWLFKVYSDNSQYCSQFANTDVLYKEISRELVLLLDAVIVNSKQRDSIGLLVDKLLYNTLCVDRAAEQDIVVIDRIIDEV